MWQIHNTRKLDVIRNKIEELNLDYIDKSVILTSLILAMDEVDNSLGHHVSYLKDWCPRSYNQMKMKLPNLINHNNQHIVIKDDIFNTIKNNNYDLAYFDPPYGSNNIKIPSSRVRYNSYYHLWTTIIKNDKPELFGKSNRRVDSSDKIIINPFENYRYNNAGINIAMESIEMLIKNTNCKYIALSYSSDGNVEFNTIINILNKYGTIINVLNIDYKRNVMSTMKWTNEWIKKETNNKEYIFLLSKY